MFLDFNSFSNTSFKEVIFFGEDFGIF
jgi:hypothetical protein